MRSACIRHLQFALRMGGSRCLARPTGGPAGACYPKSGHNCKTRLIKSSTDAWLSGVAVRLLTPETRADRTAPVRPRPEPITLPQETPNPPANSIPTPLPTFPSPARPFLTHHCHGSLHARPAQPAPGRSGRVCPDAWRGGELQVLDSGRAAHRKSSGQKSGASRSGAAVAGGSRG